jgi:hypothetical protein
MIMERSGHLSTGGVRSYERTTEQQKKSVSDLLSDSNSKFSDSREPLKDIVNAEKKEAPEDNSVIPTIENQNNSNSASSTVSEVLKQFSFGNLEGCTYNFNFR